MNLVQTAKTLIARGAIASCVASSVTMGYKSHKLALNSYPPKHTWRNMDRTSKCAEYVRHGVIVSSGLVIGVTCPFAPLIL